MRVTIFGTYNEQETGPSQVTAGLSSALARQGIDIELLTHGDRTDPPHPEVEIVHMGETPGGVFGFLRLYRRVRSHVQETAPDIFHALEDYSYAADVRTVQWAHTSIDLLRDRRFPGTNVSFRSLAGEIPLYAASRFGASRSGYLVAQSPVTERQMGEYWRLSSDEIIPLGIEEDTIQTPQDNSDPLRILFPGRITPKKGQQRVLEHLSPGADEYRVDIVGSVVDENYLDSQWTDNCHGFVDRDQLTEFYMDADIVVIPSYHETFSITALEAIGHSCTLVISNDCGFAQFETVADCDGVKVFEQVSDGVSAIQDWICKDTLTPEKESVHSLSNKFTWRKVANQYLKIYQRIMNGR